MKTFSTGKADIKRQWHVIDAQDKVLGRLATEVARLLMGKQKAIFVRNLDTGDNVVIINAEKIRVSGDKLKQKMYYRHSNYPGGFRSMNMEEMMETDPTRVIEHAVRGMLPRNILGDQMMSKLKVYVGSEHPHTGQTVTKEAAKES